MADHAYTGLTLNGDFTADGESFLLSFELNGEPIRFGSVYVGDQREAFQRAHEAGQKPAEEAAK